MILVKIFTRSTKMAVEVGGVEVLLKVGLYFLHERVWNRISIGKQEARPIVIWLTGLPCAGKTTIAKELLSAIRKAGHQVEFLDGDVVREVFPSTGFTREDRNRHIQQMGYLASRLVSNGVFVVAAFVSPYEESRNFVRKICGNFVEVYISTSLEVCEQRDVKGMYAKARRNEISQFTGVSDPYEVPVNPELTFDAGKKSVKDCVDEMKQYLNTKDPNIFRGRF